MKPFAGVPTDWLQDLTAACDAAHGEGAFGNGELAQALAAELTRRGANVHEAFAGECSPDEWHLPRSLS